MKPHNHAYALPICLKAKMKAKKITIDRLAELSRITDRTIVTARRGNKRVRVRVVRGLYEAINKA